MMTTTPIGANVLSEPLVADTWAWSDLLGRWITGTTSTLDGFRTYIVNFAPLSLCSTLYVVPSAPILVILTLCLGGGFCLFPFIQF